MHTLRELGIFVGIPEDSNESHTQQAIGLRLIGKLLALAPAATVSVGTSMRAMLSLAKALPPLSLDAQLLSPNGGDDPYSPKVRIAASRGLVISTVIHCIQEGRESSLSQNYGAVGGDFASNDLGPGAWAIAVRRAGIGDTGYVRLEKSFDVTVRRSSATLRLNVWFVDPNIFLKGSGFTPNATVKIQYTFKNRAEGSSAFWDPIELPTDNDGAFDAPEKEIQSGYTEFSVDVTDVVTNITKTETQNV